MQRTRPLRLLVLLAAAAVAAACLAAPPGDAPLPVEGPPAPDATPAPPPIDIPSPAGLGPEELVETFLRWYVEYPGHAIHDGAVGRTGYLTDDYPDRLEEIVAGYDLGSADPILCAQDYPTNIRAQPAVITGDDAVLHVTSDFPNHRLEVHLTSVEGQWRIRQVYCAPRELVPMARTVAIWRIGETSTSLARMSPSRKKRPASGRSSNGVGASFLYHPIRSFRLAQRASYSCWRATYSTSFQNTS